MKPKVKMLEKIEKTGKSPLGFGYRYEYHKIQLNGKVFFRRQKMRDNIVTSQSYSWDIDTNLWDWKLQNFL